MSKLNSKVIKLNRAVIVDGKEIKQLTMREPTVADNLLVAKIENHYKQEMQMIANLCDISIEDFSNFPTAVAMQFQKTFAEFLGVDF